MKTRIPLAAIVILVAGLLLPASPAGAQELMLRKVAGDDSRASVEVTSMFGKLPTSGYAPVRVKITNRSGRNRSISLNFKSNDGYFGRHGSSLRSSFRLSTAAGRTEEIDLIVPVTTALGCRHGSYYRLEVDLHGEIGSTSGSIHSNGGSGHPDIILSQALFTPNGSALDAELAGSSSHRHSGTLFAGSFDPLMMPADWRAYSGYDVVMITAAEWSDLDPGARTAILAWNRLGGRLIIYAPDESANLNSLGIADGNDRRAVRSFGRVEVLKINPGLKLDPAETLKLVTPKTGSDLRPKLVSLADDTGTAGNWPLKLAFGRRSFNYAIFVVVLIVFAVLVGPVNLFVFAKSGRRHRLFLTTPLISLVASAALVLLIIIQDGFGGRGFRTALVEVRADTDEHLAYVHQEQISRTGVLLASRFDISEAATISPLPLPPDRWARITSGNRGGGARYTLQPAGTSTNASGAWFQSRSEQGHAITSVIPTRGRIELVTSTDPPQLISAFEFPLEQVCYLDDNDTPWIARDLQPGLSVTCQPLTKKEHKAFIREQRQRFAQFNQRRLDRVALQPGRFLATTTTGPLVDTFPAIDWTQNHCVLTGPVVEP